MTKVPKIPGLGWVNVNAVRGVYPGGTRDSSPALQDLIAAALDEGIGDLYLHGAYRLNGTYGSDGMRHGLAIPWTTAHDLGPRLRLHGQFRLMQGADEMMLLRWSHSRGGWDLPEDSIQFDPNGFREGWAVGIVPDDMTQTEAVVHQSWNTFRGHRCEGMAEGFVLQCGPRVANAAGAFADSSNSYNVIDGKVHSCRRGLWLRSSVNECSGNNANTIAGVIGHGECNTGIQIDAGSGNTISAHLEGILTDGLPSKTATGIFIADKDLHGTSNDNNLLDRIRTESIRCELSNWNARTLVNYGFWRRDTWQGIPPMEVRGIDPSWCGENSGWHAYGEGPAACPAGYVGVKKRLADIGRPFVPHNVLPEQLRNVARLADNSHVQCMSGAFNGFARLVLGMSFAAREPRQKIEVDVALPAHALHTTRLSENPCFTFVVLNNAGRHLVAAGFTSEGRLFVDAPPGGWDIDTATNHLQVVTEYLAAVPVLGADSVAVG